MVVWSTSEGAEAEEPEEQEEDEEEEGASKAAGGCGHMRAGDPGAGLVGDEMMGCSMISSAAGVCGTAMRLRFRGWRGISRCS